MISNIIIALVGASAIYFLVSKKDKKDKTQQKNGDLAAFIVTFIVILALLSWLYPSGLPLFQSGGGSKQVEDVREATRAMKMPLSQYEDGLIKNIREDVAVGQPPF